MKNSTIHNIVFATAAMLLVTQAWAQDSLDQHDEPEAIDEIVVQGKVQRLPADLSAFPGSITVIGFDELQKMRAIVDDLGAILGNQVPGFSPSGSQTSASNFDMTLRGRKPAVFIDGVPITTPLRNGAQDIRSLHPSAIESIQVIRGSTTLYGNGGAGGVVNYITRSPSEGEIEFTTEFSTGVSLTNASDSVPFSLNQVVSGDTGLVDFIFNGNVSMTQGSFDADGDRIPPNPNVQIGMADSLIYNIFGKVGFEDGDHRFEVSGLYYEQKQDSDFQLVNGSVADGMPTSTEPETFDAARVDPGNENLVLNAVYTNTNVLGGTARIQAFYHDYKSIFEWFPNPIFPGDGQPFVEAEKFGSRIDMTTPLDGTGLGGGSISWGIDYWQDQTAQPLIDGRTFVPELKQETVAPFVQAEFPIGERLTIMGGLRFEDINIDVVDYTALFSGATVTGGKINYDETTYNFGFVVQVADGIDLFGGLSQGVSVAELGRILRQTTVDIDVSTIDLEASVTDSYEIGVRGNFDTFSFSIAAFQNESDLGTNVLQVPGMEQFIVSLQPEEINGFEVTFEYEPNDNLRMGGSFARMSGETDTNNDGNFDSPLTGQRIPPSKLTGYVEHEIRDDWVVRVQGTYTGARNKFAGVSGFGRGEVNSHLIADVYTRFAVGPGDMSIAISNLLNEDYFTHTSEIANTNNRYSLAPGMTATIKYTISY